MPAKRAVAITLAAVSGDIRTTASVRARRVQVRLFAILRERAGCDSLEIELMVGATVAEAMRVIAAASEPLAEALKAMPVVMAVNRGYAAEETQPSPGDELALIPPVSGEALRPHVRVTTEPMAAERIETILE